MSITGFRPDTLPAEVTWNWVHYPEGEILTIECPVGVDITLDCFKGIVVSGSSMLQFIGYFDPDRFPAHAKGARTVVAVPKSSRAQWLRPNPYSGKRK